MRKMYWLFCENSFTKLYILSRRWFSKRENSVFNFCGRRYVFENRVCTLSLWALGLMDVECIFLTYTQKRITEISNSFINRPCPPLWKCDGACIMLCQPLAPVKGHTMMGFAITGLYLLMFVLFRLLSLYRERDTHTLTRWHLQTERAIFFCVLYVFCLFPIV
jgi:hypothetical protein